MSLFAIPTGDVELDFAQRLIQRGVPGLVIQGGGANLWTSAEAPPDGVHGHVATTVELTTWRNPGTNDSLQREFDLQVLHRFAPGPQRREQHIARKLMTDIYEALHRSGEFVGSNSGARYVEILALDGPVFLEPRHFTCNFTLFRDG